MFYIDWTYIVLVMPALILAMAAQGKVSSTFNIQEFKAISA